LRRRAQLVWDDVVEVLMGDQDGSGAIERIRRRKRPLRILHVAAL
jgi:hypothetical protein